MYNDFNRKCYINVIFHTIEVLLWKKFVKGKRIKIWLSQLNDLKKEIFVGNLFVISFLVDN